MKSTNSRIQSLRTMMSLEEKRIALQQQLEAIQGQMDDLRDQLFSNESTATTARAAVTKAAASQKPVSRNGKTQRTGRGEMKDRIVAALEAAGKQGVRVKELASALNTKPVNVHSWFHSAIKRYPSIQKISGGHYRLNGSLESSSSSSAKAPVSPKRTAGRGKAATAPKTSPARSTGARKAAGAGPSKRGELSARILSEMEDAGSRGIQVRELADKLGANYKNIHIWFSKTGNNNPKIKKLGRAQYRLER